MLCFWLAPAEPCQFSSSVRPGVGFFGAPECWGNTLGPALQAAGQHLFRLVAEMRDREVLKNPLPCSQIHGLAIQRPTQRRCQRFHIIGRHGDSRSADN